MSIEILICEVRLINLTHFCADCPVHTPMGPINLKIGTAIGHHVRLNWNVSQPEQHQCENRQLSRGTGFLTQSDAVWRLEDVGEQVDFHLELTPTRCGCISPCKAAGYAVINNKFIFLKWQLLEKATDVARDQYRSSKGHPSPSHPRLQKTS